MRKRTNIIITLKSDMCLSSGYSYAGIIDTDICVNGNGIPYLPSKRLKGVMREQTEILYGTSTASHLFGKGGTESDRCIVLDDGYISEMEEADKEISRIKLNGHDILLDEQNILELFTSIKAQTAINASGSSDENTLRYTRVVNQYLPKCVDKAQRELTFSVPVKYEEEDETILNDIVKAVRHIGVDRNRGLGNVKCVLDVDNSQYFDYVNLEPEGNSTERVRIDYTIRNTGRLMISNDKDNVTETYIKGSAVLGALAKRYLLIKGISDPDQTFNEIFLNGKSVFSNLYITDSDDRSFFPAPLYLNKLKKTKKYVCVVKNFEDEVFSDDKEENDYNPEDGNQPKKLTGKYIFTGQDGTISIMEPHTEITYHHSRRGAYDAMRANDGEDDGILYSMEVIKNDQIFSGYIIVEKQYANIIMSLLKQPDLKFGKSKSVQYGSCEAEVKPKQINDCPTYEVPDYELQEGKVLVVLESDAVIPGEYGYTTRYEDVLQYISNKTGLKVMDKAKVYMKIVTKTGYNNKINLKLSSVPAIAAGSAFEFMVPKAGKYKAPFIGSFVSEGYGAIKIIDENGLTYRQMENESQLQTVIPDKSMDIRRSIAQRQLLEAMKAYFISRKLWNRTELTPSLVGRITLMLKESRSEADSLKSFAERIVSIKRTREREKVIGSLRSWKICEITTKTVNRKCVLSGCTNLLTEENISSMISPKVLESLGNTEINQLWDIYLVFILTHIKYRLAQR